MPSTNHCLVPTEFLHNFLYGSLPSINGYLASFTTRRLVVHKVCMHLVVEVTLALVTPLSVMLKKVIFTK
jgi:hypothetical protein